MLQVHNFDRNMKKIVSWFIYLLFYSIEHHASASIGTLVRILKKLVKNYHEMNKKFDKKMVRDFYLLSYIQVFFNAVFKLDNIMLIIDNKITLKKLNNCLRYIYIYFLT